jgi:hypothetical protein
MQPGAFSTRKFVTGIIAIHHAGSIAVCREGSKVAMHIATPNGEVLVHVSEREFILGCRRECDHNGNPFRTLHQITVETRQAAEAAALPPPDRTAFGSSSRPRRSISPETLARYEEIAAIAEAQRESRQRGAIAKACRDHGVNYANFNAWRQAQKRMARGTV